MTQRTPSSSSSTPRPQSNRFGALRASAEEPLAARRWRSQREPAREHARSRHPGRRDYTRDRLRRPVDVANEVRAAKQRKRSSRRSRVVSELEQLAAQNHTQLVWPEYVDSTLSVHERIEQVWDAIEGEGRRQGRAILCNSFGKTELLDDRTAAKVTIDDEFFRAAWTSVEQLAFDRVIDRLTTDPWLSEHRDDLIQEARIALWNAISTYEGKAAFSTYAYAVLDNALRTYVRRERRWHNSWADGDVEAHPDSSAQIGSGASDGWHELIRVLDTLRDGELLLLHTAGYSDRELEATYGRHLRMRRHRAKQKLRARTTLLDDLIVA